MTQSLSGFTPPIATEAELATERTTARAAEAALAVRCTTLDTEVASLASRVAVLESPIIAPPQPSPSPSPTPSLTFSSDWSGGGVKDTWGTYDEFNNSSGVILMSVVPGSTVSLPFSGNALKVRQAGDPPGYAANLEIYGAITPGVDYYVRYYFRNDDTSWAGDHCTTCDFYQYPNLTYLRKMGGPTSWQYIKSFYGIPFGINNYPIAHWFLRSRLPNGAWFRMEDYVHWTSPKAIQVHPRIYDASGNLLYSDVDFQQSDFLQSGNLSFGGRADWTLASFYAAGYDFGVVPQYLAAFAIGNNGQQGSTATGLSWYYAKVGISNDGWIGP